MSLPERDEDFLRLISESLSRNPFRDLPDDNADNYIPEMTIKTVPKRLYEDTIADLRGEIEEYRADNARLAVERKRALADGGRITTRLNHALAQVADLARVRRTLERRLFVWRCTAFCGWLAFVLAVLVRR